LIFKISKPIGLFAIKELYGFIEIRSCGGVKYNYMLTTLDFVTRSTQPTNKTILIVLKM